MNIKTYIHDLQISEGDSVRSDCPSCRGRKTFTVTKMNGKILYNCYKLACGTRGVEAIGYTKREIGERLSRMNDDTSSVEDDFIMPEYISHDISRPTVQNFINRWDISKACNAYVMYDVKDDRVVFPIRGRTGKLIDAIGRSLSYNPVKWLRYGGKADYYLSEPPVNLISCAIIVEDVISAIIASNIFGVAGVAILGTSLNIKHRNFLSQYDTVLVALDPDASKKTLEYTIDLRNYIHTVVAVPLSDDIKYKKQADINTIEEFLK